MLFRSGCEVVVLETGLGGRLDSTNVILAPLACAITALGYDHMDRLGNTLGEIAAEKAGIIKPGRPVILSDPRDLGHLAAEAEAALAAVRNRCSQQSAPLSLLSLKDIEIVSYGWDGQIFRDVQSGLTMRTGLLGLYQPQNAVLAARVCQMTGLAQSAAIVEGIASAQWPARMELVRRNPPILVDGAHNVQGCQALATTLSKLLPGQPIIFLAGMLQDKDYDGMLRAALGCSGYRPIAFICLSPDNPRALPAEMLAERVRMLSEELQYQHPSGYNVKDAVHAADTLQAGVKLALGMAGETGAAICAFGSLYLVGSLRGMLMNREEELWTGKS